LLKEKKTTIATGQKQMEVTWPMCGGHQGLPGERSTAKKKIRRWRNETKNRHGQWKPTGNAGGPAASLWERTGTIVRRVVKTNGTGPKMGPGGKKNSQKKT